jgi:hypothetical protein
LALTAGLALVGCSGESSWIGDESVRSARQRLQAVIGDDVEGMPEFPEDAIEGYYQKVLQGTVVGTVTLTRPDSAPQNLDDYMMSGQPDKPRRSHLRAPFY